MLAISFELMIFSPECDVMPTKIPIPPAKISILVNVNIILDTVISANLFESIFIMLHVTDENIMGITDMEIKVKNIFPGSANNLPVSGKHTPIKIAHTAAITVVYPLLRSFDIFPNIPTRSP